MDLWTEYEGTTIDSAFALTKLLQPEGRSAFFSTTNAKSEPVLIRIIECHFDEDEILARWRGVQALGHPNFLRMDRFGQFCAGSGNATAVYAAFERVDANLGEVLERGRLSEAAAAEIGLSVIAALETLHANGFVHEHIETRNIYAVGNTVKLRSDCIREAPEGEAGMAARQRDAHQLAMVLMQVLLGRQHGSPAPRLSLLAAPFYEIVRNGLEGSWGFTEMKAALAGESAAAPRADSPEPQQTQDVLPALVAASAHAQEIPQRSAETQDSGTKVSDTAGPCMDDLDALNQALLEPPAAQPGISGFHPQARLPLRKPAPMEVPVIFGISEHDFRRWRNAALLALAVLAAGWIFLHHALAHRSGGAPELATQAATAIAPSARQPVGAAAAFTAPATRVAAPATQPRIEWRVVAFTYMRQDQAQKKAASLTRQHANLQAAVFSPNGSAPWLVTVGGALKRDQAYALARKARSLGLPRDTYAQNYAVH